jgi:hypothetical protein
MAGGLLALHDPGDTADRSVPAIEVPPNFITIRANAYAPVHLRYERIFQSWPMDHANAAL